MQPTIYSHTAESTTHPSNTAITTSAQKWVSAQLDRLIIAQDNGNTSTLQHWTKRALEAAFVPATKGGR